MHPVVSSSRKRGSYTTCLLGFSWGVKKLIFIKLLAYKGYVKVSCCYLCVLINGRIGLPNSIGNQVLAGFWLRFVSGRSNSESVSLLGGELTLKTPSLPIRERSETFHLCRVSQYSLIILSRDTLHVFFLFLGTAYVLCYCKWYILKHFIF